MDKAVCLPSFGGYHYREETNLLGLPPFSCEIRQPGVESESWYIVIVCCGITFVKRQDMRYASMHEYPTNMQKRAWYLKYLPDYTMPGRSNVFYASILLLV